jgi:maltose alpha-D-glucosyltransferase/alpha-amylase
MSSSAPWFKTAVFYEVPVYAFADSTGNGIGDFRGLTERLDYLQWLGVDCLWILPFYESPLRDGGYDVSDFRAVLPRYGTLDDVDVLLAEAHRRGLRVIADMIVNHTSDEHPWFREARRPASPTRDRYVWSDDPTRYGDARVIFIDTHDANWTWDPVAGAYYWHRFFDHQPDLNYDNPEVREEVIDVVRFWLKRGFDGLRLDAVPYLYEREGTNGENLPETHAFLRELRSMVDDEFEDRILLAEANQPPGDVVAYFGDGDECHMAFHFPVMPRLFMALEQGRADAVIDILERTPSIPENAQWGIFLRNHDELTLEMVTEEERAFMYERYAPDPEMRSNVGIRRRLAPLLDGDRRRIELLHGLLLSLPGSPTLYYGDEIAMGNEYLDDRDGIRTPMQWEPAAHGGFSAADPADLYLPIVSVDGYSPHETNVADQKADPDSLLNWVRSMLRLRRRHPVFGIGGFTPTNASDPAVLSFLRDNGEERVLVVANVSNRSVTTTVEVAGRWEDLLSPGPTLAMEDIHLDAFQFRWFTPQQ